MNTRNLEIYRLKNEEGYSTTDLAKIFNVSQSRISIICNSVEHEKRRLSNSYFLMELPLRMHIVLRKEFASESNATIEKVAKLDPLKLVNNDNLGQKSLKQTKDILLQYGVLHLMHKNWKKI